MYKNENFPFQDNEEVIIDIDNGNLVISKNEGRSKILRDFGVENATLPNLINLKAERNKDLPFLYFKDKIYSYKDVNIISNKIANGILELIKNLGVESPKISILMNNCPQYIFTWFGIAKAGCIFVPIDKTLENNVLKHVLCNSDTKVLFIDYEFLDNFKEIGDSLEKIKKVLIWGAPDDFNFDDKFVDFKSIISSQIENPQINIYDEDPVEILYTGGITGKPKGVVYRNVVIPGITLGYELKEIGLNKSSKIYCPMPLSRGSAQFFSIIASLFYDISVVLSEGFNVSTFWEDINKYNPTCFCYYRGYLLELLYKKPKINDRIHSLKFAFGFGAEIDLWEAFEKRFGIPLYECWAHSEGIGITINKVGSKGGKVGSIGTPLDFLELKIVDSDDKELSPGPNNVGEILVRRKSGKVFEYYKQLENQDVRIDDDNWVHTNDFGYTDHDGYIYFKGKRKEIIFKGDEVIYAKDIERVANSHPNIIQTAVFPIKLENPQRIDLGIVAIRVKNRSITHEELTDYLYHNLAYNHVPRYLEIRDKLPKTLTTEFLKDYLIKEWEIKRSENTTWDTRLHRFLDTNVIQSNLIT
ncbi:MAG: AMP-binding protein [Candidatus Thorarchaeota archaeon]